MTPNTLSVAEPDTVVNDLGEWVVTIPVTPQPEPVVDVVAFMRRHRPQLTEADVQQLRKEGWL